MELEGSSQCSQEPFLGPYPKPHQFSPCISVAVNILNKQLWTADKGWASSFRVRRGANNLQLKKGLLWIVTKDGLFGKTT
jgi:hypothetical protein